MKTNLMFGTIVAGLALLAAGCETVGARQHRSNSLFAYLYSKESGHTDEPAIPVISLPLRVGVAFVPAAEAGERHSHGYRTDPVFAEKEKLDLARQVSEAFAHHEFIKSVEIIPSAYLAPNGGFENLEQLRRIYGVEVMVLLSYDQVQFTDQDTLALSYWTIVGAYVVQGEKNDTKTMLDAAVYDIASRKLLFRAPGLSEVKGSATPVNLSEQLRHDSGLGFSIAATNLVTNLAEQLDAFKERVKEAPTDIRIERKPGYTGAGDFGIAEVALVGMLGSSVLLARWNRKS